MTELDDDELPEIRFAEVAFKAWCKEQGHMLIASAQYKPAFLAGYDIGIRMAVEPTTTPRRKTKYE